MNIAGKIVSVSELQDKEIQAMCRLMQKYYHGVSRDIFDRDLQDKNKAILLTNAQGIILGFSTQKFFRIAIQDRQVNIVYSGDTIIEKEYWGTTALPVTFGKMMLEIKKQSPAEDLYWFLISKGFRTYRFMPVFFKEFYPRADTAIPVFERQLLDMLGKTMFHERYDPAKMIIRAYEGYQYLNPDIGEITSSRLRNRDIAFFLSANPGHARGDELACIAEFEEGNLTEYILKKLI